MSGASGRNGVNGVDRFGGERIAVWTDFGGVLTPPLSHTMAVFCARVGVRPEILNEALGKVTARYGTEDVMLPIDTPLVTEAEWLAEIGEVLAADHGITLRLTTLADIWFDGRETNHAWVDALRAARGRGAFVGMLSNMVPTWDAHWRRMVDPAELFDDVLLSFEVGHRKPSPEMFALAAERAGVPPERCLLVDDLAHNCAGAEAAGWRALHFTDPAEAVARLAETVDKGV
ncbi:HAD family hydrolase [Streptomyces sp. NPDC127098]|uniref:HAD family hydrolase n=1 Tax=Streptomyces sp. NPDC127098 TaxID=3347137 RepID=UPI0036461670